MSFSSDTFRTAPWYLRESQMDELTFRLTEQAILLIREGRARAGDYFGQARVPFKLGNTGILLARLNNAWCRVNKTARAGLSE